MRVGSGLLVLVMACSLPVAAWAQRDKEAAESKEIALARFGKETLAQIQKDLAQRGTPLYAEYGTPDGQRGSDHGPYAFIWPSSYQVRALAAAALQEPRTYGPQLIKFVDALDQYWIVKDGIGGYAVLPKGSERYHDDNACMVLALLDAFESTKQRKYLLKAQAAYAFVASGEKKTAGGGIRQHEEKDGLVAVCATAPATLGALRLHQLTKDKRYLADAQRWYAFLISEKAGVRHAADELFHEPNQGSRAYQSAWVLQASLLLYEQEKDKQYLDEAQRLAKSSLARWIQPDGSLKETGQWGGSDLCDALLALYAVDADPRWLKAVHGMLDYLHDKGRDPQGRYGELWHEDHSKAALPKFHLLHMAPVAKAFWTASAVKAANAP